MFSTDHLSFLYSKKLTDKDRKLKRSQEVIVWTFFPKQLILWIKKEIQSKIII